MRTFDDIICEAAEAAILTNMTPVQFYKQCFYAYEEALRQQQSDDSLSAHDFFRKTFRNMAQRVDPRQGEGPY